MAQAAVLSATALLQMLLFFHPIQGRGYVLHPVLMLCAFTIRHLALPLSGVARANDVAASIRASLDASRLPLFAIVLPILALCLLFALAWRQRKISPALWFAAAAVLLAVTSYVGALGGVASLLTDVRGQGRYVLVPQSLFYLAMLALTATSGGWARRAGWVVIAWLLGGGLWICSSIARDFRRLLLAARDRTLAGQPIARDPTLAPRLDHDARQAASSAQRLGLAVVAARTTGSIYHRHR